MNPQSLSTIQRLAAETLNLPLEAMQATITFRQAGIDSLTTIDLLFAVENHFDITFPPQELTHLQTLSDVAASVDRLIAHEVRRYG
jgi:acyl carrier protein